MCGCVIATVVPAAVEVAETKSSLEVGSGTPSTTAAGGRTSSEGSRCAAGTVDPASRGDGRTGRKTGDARGEAWRESGGGGGGCGECRGVAVGDADGETEREDGCLVVVALSSCATVRGVAVDVVRAPSCIAVFQAER